ncbi:MAG: hypothetical protein ACRYGC_17565 [Janthinobacterium lividum]
MRPRASSLLAVLLAAGCTAGQPYAPSGGPAMLSSGAAAAPAGQRVAILLPLSGSNAALGQAMLRAARLALASPGSPGLDARDTGGTPEGAAEAARVSLAAGDTLILGPLTNSETAAVAPVAGAAGVAVLAFTSDSAQARPGVWVLGITADQQVGRLVAAAREDGRSRFAAVLPEGPFGQALGDALVRDTADGETPATVRRASGFAATNAALKQVSGYAARRGAAQAQLKAARESGDADAKRDAAAAVAAPAPPPPVDALLLGTGAGTLRDLGSVLGFYDLAPPAVRLLGPTLWAHDAPQLGALAGAWYVAPDPALRARFVTAYAAAGQAAPSPDAGVAGAAAVPGGAPPALADIAYDAAAVARVLAAQGYGPVALQRADGFAGTDGVFTLLPGGVVRRDLAVFQIDAGGGSHIVSGAGRPPGA